MSQKLLVNHLVAILITMATLPTFGAEQEITDPRAKEMAALMLNLNGLLCAKVISIKPLQVRKEIHEVTCIEYRGGSARKTYHLDINTGKAWRS